MVRLKMSITNIGALGTGTYELNSGVNAITGPNGSGKSTLVGALYFALTGETINGANIDTLVTWGYPSGSVELFTGQYTLSRSITVGGTAKVKFVQGKVTLNRAREVTQALSDLYGFTDLAIILKMVYFAEQYKAIEFVDTTDSNRVQMISALFGFHRLEKLRNELQKFISTIDVNAVSSEVLAQLVSALKSAEATRDSVSAQLSAESTLILTDDDVTVLEAIMAAPDEGTIAGIEAQQTALRSELVQVEDELASMPIPPTLDDSKKASDWDRHYNLSSQLVDLQIQLDKLIAQRELSPEAVTEFLDRLKQSRIEANCRKEHIQSQATLLQSGKCPITGGEPCPDLQALTDRTAIEAQLSQIDAELQQLSVDEKAMLDVLTSARQLEDSIKSVESKLSFVSAELSAIKVDTDFDVADYKKRLEDSNGTTERRQYLERRRVELTTALVALEASLIDVRGMGTEKSAAEKQEASNRLKASSEAKAKVAVLVSTLSQAESQVAEQLEAVQFAEDQNSRAQAGRSKVEFLNKIRHVFHRDNLPRLLVEDMLEVINTKLATYLSKFSFPYTVVWSSGGAMMYTDGTGDWHKVSQLSGGQKYVLVLSLRCALADLLGSSFPLFVLDEPTTGLDVSNREYLSEILFSFADQNPNKVLVIPTHDDMLLPEANIIQTN